VFIVKCPPSAPLRHAGFSRREDFWIIVAARSEDETEIRAGEAAGGRRDQGHSARDTWKEASFAAEPLLFDDRFDAIEDGVRSRVRDFIEAWSRRSSPGRYRARATAAQAGADDAAPLVVGVRHGHRERTLTGTFGQTRIAVPRARLLGEDGRTSDRAYQRRTRAADALIAGAYLSGTNTRRVRRTLAAVFPGPVGKDVVSRAWRKV
jgi:hypothetical protein